MPDIEQQANLSHPAAAPVSPLYVTWRLWRLLLREALFAGGASLTGPGAGGAHQRAVGRGDLRRRLGPLILGIFVVMAFLPFEGALFEGVHALTAQAVRIGQAPLLATVLVLGGQWVVLFFGFFYSISGFYFAQDWQRLMALPLRPWQIMVAKLGLMLAQVYATLLLFFAAPVVAFGVAAGAGILQWAAIVSAFILIPWLPLALDSLVVLPLMRYTAFQRYRNSLRIVLGLAFLVLVVWWNAQASRMAPQASAALQSLLAQPTGLARLISEKFPPSLWGGLAMAWGGQASGWANLLAFAAVSLLGLALAVLAGERWLYPAVQKTFEAGSRRGRLKTGPPVPVPPLPHTAGATTGTRSGEAGVAVAAPAGWRAQPLWLALWLREVRDILRTPTYLLNAAAILILPPLMLVAAHQDPRALPQVLALVAVQPWWAALIMAGAVAVLSLTNPFAYTAVSREGKWFWISRTLPVPAARLAGAKVASAMAFPAVLGVEVFVLALWLAPGLSLYLLLGLILGLEAALGHTMLGVAVDYRWPRLKWVDPQQVMKRNLNTLIGTAVGMVFLGLLAALAWFLRNYLGAALLYALLLAVVAVAVIRIWPWTRRQAQATLAHFEG
ncbi:MAG: hypothetical protein IMW99_06315 [Firmicutes bacterium]|nr:hypothetical protein [Bacillota bacterium]